MKRWLTRLGLLVGGALAGLVLSECAARQIAPMAGADLLFNSPDASPIGLYLNDPKLLMVPAPGFSGRIRSVDHAVDLRVNALGMRGPEVEPGAAPTAGTDGEARPSRWLAVGDSFTLSVQVPEDQTFEQLLASALRGEVHNAGVDGYSTWQATGRYEQLVPELKPDGVLLVFFMGNDLADNERFPHVLAANRHHTPGTAIPRVQAPWHERMLLRHSNLWAHLRIWQKKQAIASGQDPVRGQWADELSIFSKSGQGRLQQLIEPTRRALVALRDKTRAHGDVLLVAIAPPAFVVDRNRAAPTFELVGLDPGQMALDTPTEAVVKVLRSAGITSCDLTPDLRRAQDTGTETYLEYDGHWTAAGHQVVAQTLAQCVGGSQ